MIVAVCTFLVTTVCIRESRLWQTEVERSLIDIVSKSNGIYVIDMCNTTFYQQMPKYCRNGESASTVSCKNFSVERYVHGYLELHGSSIFSLLKYIYQNLS